jgi:hypothetical protein
MEFKFKRALHLRIFNGVALVTTLPHQLEPSGQLIQLFHPSRAQLDFVRDVPARG